MNSPALMLLVLSPAAAAIGLLAYFLMARKRAATKPSAWEYFSTVSFWAIGTLVAAGIVDAAVISAFLGDRPFAIFVFGPPALAVGGIIGAVMWRRQAKT